MMTERYATRRHHSGPSVLGIRPVLFGLHDEDVPHKFVARSLRVPIRIPNTGKRNEGDHALCIQIEDEIRNRRRICASPPIRLS